MSIKPSDTLKDKGLSGQDNAQVLLLVLQQWLASGDAGASEGPSSTVHASSNHVRQLPLMNDYEMVLLFLPL